MGPVFVLESLGGRMPILIKPFLFLIAFGPIAVLFASVFGLACLLLMMCVRAIAWLVTLASLRRAGPKPKDQIALVSVRGGETAFTPMNCSK
jgi:hypothetical protein